MDFHYQLQPISAINSSSWRVHSWKTNVLQVGRVQILALRSSKFTKLYCQLAHSWELFQSCSFTRERKKKRCWKFSHQIISLHNSWIFTKIFWFQGEMVGLATDLVDLSESYPWCWQLTYFFYVQPEILGKWYLNSSFAYFSNGGWNSTTN